MYCYIASDIAAFTPSRYRKQKLGKVHETIDIFVDVGNFFGRSHTGEACLECKVAQTSLVVRKMLVHCIRIFQLLPYHHYRPSKSPRNDIYYRLAKVKRSTTTPTIEIMRNFHILPACYPRFQQSQIERTMAHRWTRTRFIWSRQRGLSALEARTMAEAQHHWGCWENMEMSRIG